MSVETTDVIYSIILFVKSCLKLFVQTLILKYRFYTVICMVLLIQLANALSCCPFPCQHIQGASVELGIQEQHKYM